MLFPSIIDKIGNAYNKSFVLVEVNDIGEQVSNMLQFDLEYENLLMCAMRGQSRTISRSRIFW